MARRGVPRRAVLRAENVGTMETRAETAVPRTERIAEITMARVESAVSRKAVLRAESVVLRRDVPRTGNAVSRKAVPKTEIAVRLREAAVTETIETTEIITGTTEEARGTEAQLPFPKLLLRANLLPKSPEPARIATTKTEKIPVRINLTGWRKRM